MTNEELLQKVLNSTVERFGKQAVNYEAEIANLNSQIMILNGHIEEIKNTIKEKPAKVTPLKEE